MTDNDMLIIRATAALIAARDALAMIADPVGTTREMAGRGASINDSSVATMLADTKLIGGFAKATLEDIEKILNGDDDEILRKFAEEALSK